jgi:hypothetical protein
VVTQSVRHLQGVLATINQSYVEAHSIGPIVPKVSPAEGGFALPRRTADNYNWLMLNLVADFLKTPKSYAVRASQDMFPSCLNALPILGDQALTFGVGERFLFDQLYCGAPVRTIIPQRGQI